MWNDWEPTEPYLAPMPRAIDDDGAGKVTADDFAYLRLTGNHDADIDYRTATIDRGADLARWAKRVLRFRRERDGRGVYVLLNWNCIGSADALTLGPKAQEGSAGRCRDHIGCRIRRSSARKP